MNKELREKCIALTKYNTFDNIQVLVIEELSELIQVIAKLRRWEQDDLSLRKKSVEIALDLLEEVADVYIALEQLNYITCNTDEALNRVIKQKLNRTYGVLGIKEEKE